MPNGSRCLVSPGVLVLGLVAAMAACGQRRAIVPDGASVVDGAGTGGLVGSGGHSGLGGVLGATGGASANGGAVGTGGGAPGGAIATGGVVGTGGVTDGGAPTGGAPMGGGGQRADAAIDGAGPAMLLLESPMTYDYGGLEVGLTSAAKSFTIHNIGGAPSGPLMLQLDNPTEVITTGCTGSLAAGASCMLSVAFRPMTAGPLVGNMTLSASPGGRTDFFVTALGMNRLTVTVVGMGSVTITGGGMDKECTGTCTGIYKPSGVSLSRKPGANQLFAGWSGGACPTVVSRTCSPALTSGAATVTATFVPQTANLIFLTRDSFPPNLGAPQNYDDQCNVAATAAGLNDASGKAFVALMSSAASSVNSRLGTARGWIRLDGQPVFDTLSAAFDLGQVFNAVQIDETGLGGGSVFVSTGFNADGSSSADTTCTNWTGTGTGVKIGKGDGGPGLWVTGPGTSACTFTDHVYCLGKTRTTTVKPTVTAGKRIWAAAGFTVGGGKTPDAACQAAKPADVTTAMALIATTTRAASAILSPAANYVRPDGTLVATGAQLALSTGGVVKSGIWQYGDGTYVRELQGGAWTGSQKLDTAGTAADTCGNWTTTTGDAPVGNPQALLTFWSAGRGPCGGNNLLYCVQTAP